ncbi:MAG: cell division protein ZapB [Nitrospirae bacterium]|nr:cell division protein ZapB [Nitrospirota bacterium]
MTLEKIKVLEDRVSEVLEYIKVLQRERMELERKLMEKDAAVKEIQHQMEAQKRTEDECNRMKEERTEVRSRVETILDTLKGIGGVK